MEGRYLENDNKLKSIKSNDDIRGFLGGKKLISICKISEYLTA